MFRPRAFLTARCARLLLLAAALAFSWTGGARCHADEAKASDVPVYTDEDLKPKPKTPAPASVQAEAAPSPQTQPQGAAAPAGRQPQTRPAGVPAPPAGPKPQTRPADPAPAPKVSVASAPPPPAPAPAAQESQLWTREWKRQQETREYWQRRVDTAKQAVERIEQRIQYLERKRASIQNPFIPRPTLSEEDRVAEEGMDGAMRLARVEGQLASAREELAASRGAVEKAEQEMSAALAPEPPSGFAPSTN